jgi:hypothetical protein
MLESLKQTVHACGDMGMIIRYNYNHHHHHHHHQPINVPTAGAQAFLMN